MEALDIEVRLLLASRKGQWPLIAKQAGVSHSWVSKFVRGEIDNPRIRTLQRLDVFLRNDAKQEEQLEAVAQT
jgi:transcriptional regulator with XRE-family HTH domain